MKYAIVLILASLLGCAGESPEISAQLAQQVAKNDSIPIDLAQLGPASWERVCILPPYTTNTLAEHILGFKWNAERETNIATNDGINVIVFATGNQVVAYSEHSRKLGDLSELKPSCLPRAKALVVRRARSDGWVHLVAQNAA